MGNIASLHLTELHLGDRCLDGVLNNNNYESDILKVRGSGQGRGDLPRTFSVTAVTAFSDSATTDSQHPVGICLFPHISKTRRVLHAHHA